MGGVLEGVKVIEIAGYAVATSAGAVLGDWGASVIKIEPPTGDPMRGIAGWAFVPEPDGPTLSDVVNRNKRSLTLDLNKPEARDVLRKLVEQSDVFVTNYLPAVREKLHIDVADIRAINPNIIYARASAYGPRGEEARKGGFDGSTYWQRSGSGIGAMQAVSGDLVPLPGPGFGDVQTGYALAGGIVAALYHRERTGEAKLVDTSLMNMGLWAMQMGIFLSGVLDVPQLIPTNRNDPTNPLNNAYRTSDDRFVALGMIQNSNEQWAVLCDLTNLPELISDARFATRLARQENAAACVAVLDEAFATRNLAHWSEMLSGQKWPWTVVQRVGDVINDAQAIANGYVQEITHDDGRVSRLIASPAQFDETAPVIQPAPEQGQHSEEVLLELGLSWEEIGVLRDAAAIL